MDVVHVQVSTGGLKCKLETDCYKTILVMFFNYLTNLAGSILVGYQEIVCKRSDSYIYKTH